MSSPSDTYAGTFEPTLETALDDTTPEVPSGFTSEFGITEEHTNFAAVVAYIPPSWGVVPGENIPIGAEVGSLDAQATLGLINSACNQILPVHFDFKNSSLDQSDTVSFDDDDNNGTQDFAEDKDGDGDYDSVTKYPEFLVRLFEDVDRDPIRRSSGIAIVAGIPVLLQFLIFPPGTEINEDLPSEENLGYPSVTVLQNAGDPEIVPQPSPITDFCAPLSTQNVTLGSTPEGVPTFINPAAGVHTFTTVSFGQRDADNDGFENSLDTCPYDVNEGNPKETLNGDLDDDGLDVVCDPNDDTATGGKDTDEDADGYSNRQDNCPLIANGEAEVDVEDVGNQADEDTDQIGDACDTDPTVEDGDLTFSQLEVEVTIGEGGADCADPICPPSAEACTYEGENICYPYEPGQQVDNGNGNGDDDGSNTGLIIGIAVGVIAAVVILGGGAAMLMRRRNGA
jgi:hypothetical protein